ncbi:MarR family transcriptional regulator [Brevibacillus humidisoli]|uniref:GbsR/MarR family transcriptional regulator n=1 Tax=Brevibacillus humidisoli TaxID=2895522 RepID=UPI001E3A1367|nr:MarR family transcriptional regulator [Brevibacillus humidisoli]UFJ43036.1 MarR family transcriptional regulator [Brevibacillus humidisoli]
MESVLHQLERKLSDEWERSGELGGNSALHARLLALLFFSARPLSLQEMAEHLGVTKAAVSVRIRALEEQGFCHKSSNISDRRDYYYLVEDLGMAMLTCNLENMYRFSAFLKRLLEEWPADYPTEEQEAYAKAKRRLIEMNAFYDLLFERLDGLEEEWKRRKQELSQQHG